MKRISTAEIEMINIHNEERIILPCSLNYDNQNWDGTKVVLYD